MHRLDSPEAQLPGAADSGAQEHLKVLVVGVSWPLESFVERLLVGLARDGMDLTLAPVRSFARPPNEWLDRHGIAWANDLVERTPHAVARVALGRGAGSLGAVLQPSRLAAGTRHHRQRFLGSSWDVVYAPWINALTGDDEILDVMFAPIVTSCRGSLISIAPWDPSRPTHGEAIRRVFDRAEIVHCVSRAIVSDAAALGLDVMKARVVPPAVDPLNFPPKSHPGSWSERLRVVSVGTLNWTKDQEHALRAIREAVKRGAGLSFDIIGDGPDRQHLQFAIDDLDLTDRVRLLGRRSPEHVAGQLRDADVFLHTSSSEGISNAVLEAMATGLPIVTTDAGGMREAVRDGVDGFVVRVRDTDSAADALVSLAADPDLRARMGASGRQRIVDEFRLDQQIAAFAELLREAAGR